MKARPMVARVQRRAPRSDTSDAIVAADTGRVVTLTDMFVERRKVETTDDLENLSDAELLKIVAEAPATNGKTKVNWLK